MKAKSGGGMVDGCVRNLTKVEINSLVAKLVALISGNFPFYNDMLSSM